MTEQSTQTADAATHTLEAPGATLTYDVHPAEGGSDEPPLMLIGSPMDARGFGSLRRHFRDRTVVTYDPRGVNRSPRTDGANASTPDEHGDDLYRVISDLGAERIDIFGSSGGATNALVLVARHPELVRTLIAHEPPVAQELPDREAVIDAATDINRTYERDGLGPAMAKFMVLSGIRGPVPDYFADQPAPDPAQFGLPTEDDGSRDDALLGQNIVNGTRYELDFEALRAAPTRIVLAAGAESEGEMTHRAALAVADRLGTKAVIFPSHHGGFLGGEFGWSGEPEAFAVVLRETLGVG